MRNRWLVVPGLVAAAVVLTACGTKSPSGSGPAAGAPASSPAATATPAATMAPGTVTIKTMSTSKGTVLADSAGHTLYWFANDTPTKSHCKGSCLTYWPALYGTTAVAAAGTSLPHSFGTITRPNGKTQITYDGHPLYTYTGDTAAGQVNGNDLNASGGLWWAMTPSGADLGSSTTSSSDSSGGGW